ncbi:MAG: Gfo/Idh/MocA family oxidoreductase [Hyphomicrobiales bacterium]|nr:Gfo/Idh/MocA family oxidoreductase [Hyphomicrobiales bacterium]
MATAPHKIALVGIGKIARDQHVPSIGGNPDFELAATVSRHGSVEGVEAFPDLGTMLAKRPDIGAVALCMPPQARFSYAVEALAAGRHVLLEKPPGATLSEVHELERLAAQHGCTLFATWHSRFAVAVPAAKAWLAGKRIDRLAIIWKEDVRRWHPGQEWIWEPGGLGVFDPGINALSILTAIYPHPLHLASADLSFPENRGTPIAASLRFAGPQGAEVTAEFDWRQEGPQTWDIEVDADTGHMKLSAGGASLVIDGEKVEQLPGREYARIYRRFAELIRTGRSDVDLSPMVHVADAFTLGRRIVVEPFEF